MQTFNWATLAIPALLALIPALLFYTGYKFSRHDSSSFAGKSFYWLGGHGVTLVVVTAVTLLGQFLPGYVVARLPLIITVLYLVCGFIRRSPFFFSLGLATPGLWVFFIKIWEAFSSTTVGLYNLPQDPFWYVLAAVVIFALQYLRTPRKFWEETESSLVVISGSYLMGALWLLALGQPGLLDGLGLTPRLWSVALLAVSAFQLWCANHLRDPLFAVCSIIGLCAGVYTFIV